jgi:hypothetical protein
MKLTATDSTTYPITLSALDASNPLAFLASLGTLQLLTDHRPKQSVRLGWWQQANGWRPRLDVESEIGNDQLVDEITQHLDQAKPVVPPSLREAGAETTSRWAGKLKFPPQAYRQASQGVVEQSRRLTELLAACATDATSNKSRASWISYGH